MKPIFIDCGKNDENGSFFEYSASITHNICRVYICQQLISSRAPKRPKLKYQKKTENHVM